MSLDVCSGGSAASLYPFPKEPPTGQSRLVVSALEATSDADAFGAFVAFVAQHPELSDREYPLSFYTKSRPMSDRARAEWIEPDLRPLPCGVAVFADTPR